MARGWQRKGCGSALGTGGHGWVHVGTGGYRFRGCFGAGQGRGHGPMLDRFRRARPATRTPTSCLTCGNSATTSGRTTASEDASRVAPIRTTATRSLRQANSAGTAHPHTERTAQRAVSERIAALVRYRAACLPATDGPIPERPRQDVRTGTVSCRPLSERDDASLSGRHVGLSPWLSSSFSRCPDCTCHPAGHIWNATGWDCPGVPVMR